jgi:transposase
MDLFRLMGWKIVGTIDADIKKMRNDGYAAYEPMILSGNFYARHHRFRNEFVAKKGIVSFPWVGTKYMGGEPLDRSGGMNKVDVIAEIFNRRKIFVWQFFQREREKKSEIKTGFYYIVLKPNVPIIPVAFDFGKKKLILSSTIPQEILKKTLLFKKKHLKE